MKKFLAFILTAIFMLSAMAFVGCVPVDKDDSTVVEQSKMPIITMSMGSPMAVTTETGAVYLEKTLTATVYPDAAINKLVDWSIEWDDESNESDISEYVTVTPAADGSTTAYVRCYQAFSGTITITVTTRESGLQDWCSVSYEGLASEMIISGDLTKDIDGFYYVASGLTYNFNITLNNVFGEVADKHYDNLWCVESAVGSIVVADWKRYSDNSREYVEGTEKTIEIDSIKDKYLTASIDNKVLSFTATFGIVSYYESYEKVTDGSTTYSLYKNKYKGFADGTEWDSWYLCILVKDPYTGLQEEFKIKQSSTAVSSVSLNSSFITF